MKGQLIAFISLLLVIYAVPTYAQEDTVRAVPCDSVSADSVMVDTAVVVASDTIAKKPSFFKRAYDFVGSLLSPKRDAAYIDVQDYYNWCGMLQFVGRFENYSIDEDEVLSMHLSPTFRTYIGPFFGWRFLFSGYNFDLKSIIPKSDDIDLSASIYSSAFGLDLFYRRVGGEYNIRKLVYNSEDYSNLLKGRSFDGVEMGMTRISFYYVLNYKRYSHQAAFNQTHRQIRSAGSPIFGISYAHNRVTLDWQKFSNLVSSIENANTIKAPTFSNLKNDEISLTAGYGYNFAFAKNWLAAGELSASLGYLIQHYSEDNPLPKEEEDKQYSEIEKMFHRIEDFRKKNLAINGSLRLAVLYNCGPWFAGTQAIMFYYQHGNSVAQTRNLLGSVYVYAGVNF